MTHRSRFRIAFGARAWRRGAALVVSGGLTILVNASCGHTEAFDEAHSEAGAAGRGSSSVGGLDGDAGAAAGGRGAEGGGFDAGLGGIFGAGGALEPSSTTTRLRGAPLVFAPTARELGLSVALSSGSPAALRARVRATPEGDWQPLAVPRVRADDLAEWRITGLQAGQSYEYQIVEPNSDDLPLVLFTGRGVTQRPPGDSFRFALISDTHIGANLDYSNQGDELVLEAVAKEVGAAAPDFVINLGDLLDFHEFGFNDPPPNGALTRSAYLNYRASFGSTLGTLGHFGVLGNWDGENGSFTSDEIARSRDQRLLYLPNPGPTTYPEGGGSAEDYYAFPWGDALFVVLNVMSYTTTAHLLSSDSGLPDDWTLGGEQLTWLTRTLQNASAKWRFLFIHHTVGGAAGDAADSAYGRGGGRAARVGEQAEVHDLMLKYGVQVFFYGHDHVFTDMVVDGVHYTAPGNAGAIWTFPGAQTGYTQYWEQSGWAQVDVTPDAAHVQFNAVGGGPLFDYALTP